MRHPCLPEKMTIEQLATWIDENQKSTITHVTKVPLTPDEITDLEHKSSIASRAIDRLNEVMDEFKEFIQYGTGYDSTAQQHLPQSVTIPPTVGMKILKENRSYADGILEKGYNEETTEIYIIPYPEESLMVAVDIEGIEWYDYTKMMTEPEKELYGKLFYKDSDGTLQQVENMDMRVDGETAKIKVPKNKKKDKEAFI